MSRGALLSVLASAALVWSLATGSAQAAGFFWQVMSQGCPGVGCTAGVDLDYHRQKAERRENELGKSLKPSEPPAPPKRQSNTQTYSDDKTLPDKFPIDRPQRRPELAVSPTD